MGLREDHPEKDGVLVDLDNMIAEIKERIRRKAELDSMITQAEGMRVVGGIRGAPAESKPAETTETEVKIAEVSTAPAVDGVKPESASDDKAGDLETIGAVPAS